MDRKYWCKGKRILIMSAFFLCLLFAASSEASAARGYTITLSTKDVTLFVGDSYRLSAYFTPVVKGKSKIRFYLYDLEGKKRLKESSQIKLNKKTGEIKALKRGKIGVQVIGSYWNKKAGCYDRISDICEISIAGGSEFSLNKTKVVRAVGSTGQKLKVNDGKEADSISWVTSNPEVVTVDQDGNTVPVGKGNALIRAEIRMADSVIYYECDYVVTEPVLDKQQITLEERGMTELSLSGISDISKVSWSSEDEKIATVDERGHVSAVSPGSTRVTVEADGVTLGCSVEIKRNMIASRNLMLLAGSKKNLIPSIDTATASVRYTSSDENVATVDQKGCVKALSQGNATILLKAGSSEEEFHIAVLENEIGMSVVSDGLKRIEEGCQYSTAKRMEEGYYDCSSFVFRLYAPYGITFGVSPEANAPTAAGLAKWLSVNGEVLEYGPVYDLERMLPGDLIFYNYSGENGRYLNIDHVSIYEGYEKIIHASDEKSGVKEANLWIDNYIVMVARPTVSGGAVSVSN